MAFLWMFLFLVASSPAAFAQQGSLADETDEAPVDSSTFRSGLLLIPYVGANLALGDTSKAFNLGYRVGGIGGWHVLPFLSLNGELTVDRPGPIDVENGYVLKATATDLAFSPLIHLALDQGDFVFGLKVGAFRYTTSLSIDWTGEPPKVNTEYGLAYGLNLGVFGSLEDFGVGVVLGFTGRHEAERCPTIQNDTPYCPRGRSDLKLLTVAVAVLY